jgi:hypothetical protein
MISDPIKIIRNSPISIIINKISTIFFNKDDRKKNISELNDLSIKVETLMDKLRNIEKGKKIEQKQEIPKELDGLKGNHEKINNSIYKKIFRKIRTNISNVFKNTVKLVGKILSTTQKVTKSLIENIRKQILINKIKQINDKIMTLGGKSQLSADLYSKSIGALIDLRKEVRQEKDVPNGKESNQKIASPEVELKNFAFPNGIKISSVESSISSKNLTPLRQTQTKTQTQTRIR